MISDDPEACLVCCEVAVVADDLGGVGLGGCEAGSYHVGAGEEFFVCVGVFVVVVEEPARSDVCVEEPAGANGGEDALGGCPYFGGVFEPPGTDAVLQRAEFGFGGGDDLGCAGGVTPGAGVGFDHNRAGAVIERHIGGAAAALGDFNPGGIIVDGRKGLCGDGVAA